jgi:hypothetical protein
MPVELKELNDSQILEAQATGKISADDYVRLLPIFKQLKQQHGKLRVLFKLHDFHGWTAGGLWEDVKFEVKHFSDIERLAIIGETRWQEGMAGFCKPFTTALIRFFPPDQEESAREWLAFPPPDPGKLPRPERDSVGGLAGHSSARGVKQPG